ncbi:hypothetical protein KI387_014717, partial [Taxus chinensis]
MMKEDIPSPVLSLHAVVVPLPAQGHVNPLLHFSDLLRERGFFITFVNTEWSEKRMLQSSKQFSHRSSFRFLSFSDGLPPEHGRTDQLGELTAALAKCGPVLEELLRRDDGSCSGIPPVTCIVTDSPMSCTLSVAANLGVPRVVFWSICAAASIAQKYANVLLSQGHIPVKVAVSEAKRPEKLISGLPWNIPDLLPTDLMSFYREQNESDVMFKASLFESQQSNEADYTLVNTFEELEGRDAISALSTNGCPALAVGPVFLPKVLQGVESKLGSMWGENESCLEWLDKQRTGSVLYVSFGSLALKSQQQLDEIALGLEGSGQPFLWVLRSDIAQGHTAVLPEGFQKRTTDRAFIASWTPQLKVLEHESVGGFLTHSGWNSTLEGISMGVPLVGWPCLADQFLNCRFAKEIWKVGLDFKDVDVDENRLVTREEVESAVRDLMQNELLRKRAFELKEAAIKAVMPG